MSITEKSKSSYSSSSLQGEIDPLLKDLSEKKQSFRRNVESLAEELKLVRSRLAQQEQSFAKESLTRQEEESKAKKMEEEISRLKRNLEVRSGELRLSASMTEKYLKDMGDLKLQLSETRATAEASLATAETAEIQHKILLKELDEKNRSVKDHESRVNKLGVQLNNLQKDLQAREYSQNQLKVEVLRIEHDIMEALAKAGESKDCELRKILDDVLPRNFQHINKILLIKDEEIAKLRDEIRVMSAHWKLKTQELESQWEKHKRADQELKKRVLKLEFCLQEARSQTRKLQRMGERRDKALKELRDQLSTKQQSGSDATEKPNIWESSGFKVIVSMSMIVLVLFSKR